MAEDIRADHPSNVDAVINYLNETRETEFLLDTDAGVERLVQVRIKDAEIAIFYDDYPESVFLVAQNKEGDELVLELAHELDQLDIIED